MSETKKATAYGAAGQKTWQKVVYLSGTNSYLMSGDPDFGRLKDTQDHVLHPLLGDGWTIRSITPVMGGTAFVLMEKSAEATA
jgi:hypothetical protein